MRHTLLFGILLSTSVAAAASTVKSCAATTCAVGDTVTTVASKSEPYYACPTRELSDYTAVVLGMTAMTRTLTGSLPNISDKTGEPEYLDGPNGPNKSRLMLDFYRSAAKVATFDQAVSMCSKGMAGLKVSVMNVPTEGMSIWVGNPKTKTFFWALKSNLEKP